jgi:hypothetical protein
VLKVNAANFEVKASLKKGVKLKIVKQELKNK